MHQPMGGDDEIDALRHWSEFYARRRAKRAVDAMTAADATQPLDIHATCDEATLARLSALRDVWRRGGYPDDAVAGLNAHRLAFARWLVDAGKLSEDDATETGHDNG